MDRNGETDHARELHNTLEFIGIRAHATMVGLLQLSAELVRAGVLDDAAVQRIKDAIYSEVSLAHSRGHYRAEFEETLRRRLDAIFPKAGGERATRVGDVDDLRAALDDPDAPRE
ncbi:MAG TPA: hypothetical protein VM662_16505 [Sphingomonas sp.]|nr:hypothetical protein [Sphingomonas sp.]